MRHLKLFMLLALTRVALVHAGNAILSEPVSFYGTDEAKRIAENLLVYQHDNGGWPKNYDWKKELTEADKKRLLAMTPASYIGCAVQIAEEL
jgi:hypothetical protein